MRLMTAHRILIATAVVFFLAYAGWEAAGISQGRGSRGRAIVSGLGAAGLGIYFRSLKGQ
ncbi:MAG TPA: hypothetical protein VGR67_04220 [Candidatus Polarisedimenticolia bacterium]|jgi:hypothetical protein|nr:hypothetical protein [Candidatus Polarisedimenticolia bacterium]